MSPRSTPLQRLQEARDGIENVAAALNSLIQYGRNMGLDVTPNVKDGFVDVTVSRPHREEEK